MVEYFLAAYFYCQLIGLYATHIMSNLRQIQEKKPHDQGQYLSMVMRLFEQCSPKETVGNYNIDGGNPYIYVTG